MFQAFSTVKYNTTQILWSKTESALETIPDKLVT